MARAVAANQLENSNKVPLQTADSLLVNGINAMIPINFAVPTPTPRAIVCDM